MNRVFLQLMTVRGMSNPMLILPIRVAWLTEHLMNISDISVFKAIFSITITLMEVPTGIVADMISRRLSMMLGAFCFSIHAIFYILMPNFLGFALTQIVLGLGNSFMSGADSAYLHNHLKNKNNSTGTNGESDGPNSSNSDNYLKVAGKIRLFNNIFWAILSLCSSLLFAFNKESVFYFSSAMGIIAFIAAYKLPQDKIVNLASNSWNFNFVKKYLEYPLMAIKKIINTKELLLMAMLTCVVMSFLIFNFEMYQIKFAQVGIPIQYFGSIYAVSMLLTGLGGGYAEKIVKRLSHNTAFIFLSTAIVSSFIIMGVSNSLIGLLVSIILQQFAYGTWDIVMENIVLDHAPFDDMKSTLVSMNSFIFNLFKSGLVVGLGIVGQKFGLNFAYIAMSAMLVLVLTLITIMLKKQKRCLQ
ncbi:MAG: MFS transporter [Oligoflexia bacterium]|nr:MFS transporter [Oligoflexia bacterium]